MAFLESARRSLTRAVATLLILALAGAVVFLLSELNTRTYSLAQQGDLLLVLKGRTLPVGSAPYRPGDPALTDAYAPIPLDGMDPSLSAQQRFTDRDELDRALFEILARLARPKVESDQPAALERGLYYVRRAQMLSGLSPEQKIELRKLQESVSYYLARSKLDDARRLVEQALADLHVAAETANPHARSANQMILAVEPSAKAFDEALRRAVHALSTPATAETPSAGERAQPPATDGGASSRN